MNRFLVLLVALVLTAGCTSREEQITEAMKKAGMSKTIVFATSSPSVGTVRPISSPPRNPRIIPWVECQYADEAQIKVVVDGLKIWRRVTDTAIVSTVPGREDLYVTLAKMVPGMQIIPGLTTSPRLGHDSFASIEGWKLLGQDIEAVVQASGKRIVVLEHESSINSWLRETATLDMEELRQALQYVPSDVQLWWYPGIVATPECQTCFYRTIELCRVVQSVVDVRFVDFSFSSPSAPSFLFTPCAKQIGDTMGEHPTLPIVYFQGCSQSMTYWQPSAVQEILNRTAGRPDVIFYPCLVNWSSAAEGIAKVLGR